MADARLKRSAAKRDVAHVKHEHDLVRTIEAYGKGAGFKCDVCGVKYDTEKVSYHCKLCTYDECSVCYAAAAYAATSASATSETSGQRRPRRDDNADAGTATVNPGGWSVGGRKAKMLFPTAGRRGFAPLSLAPGAYRPDKATLLQWLRAECAIRRSASVQASYDADDAEDGACESNLDGVDQVAQGAQIAALRECGVAESDLPAALAALRAAQSLYPGDADVRAAAFYIEHNRAEDGSLRVGDKAPDCKLWSTEGLAATTLHDTLAKTAARNRVTVLVAGSGS